MSFIFNSHLPMHYSLATISLLVAVACGRALRQDTNTDCSETAPPCLTETIHISTITRTFGYEITECISFQEVTVAPSTTLYTGSYIPADLSTETLNSYGDLYQPGDLASTPTCPPIGCSGTATTTLSETLTTSTTAGPEGPYATYTAFCTETIVYGSTITKTQHLRCAPTNIISAVDGHGIERPVIIDGTQVHHVSPLPVDESDCCQMCLEEESCAASYSLTRDGTLSTCVLVTQPDCGIAMNYSDSAAFEYSYLDPANGGYRIQTGCGTVRPIVYEDNCVG